jgi:A/G-specific adenine glycosylase
VLAWYDRHRRALPWRAPPGRKADPYEVWLSEIMLQQTTVTAVAPYFAAFVARWPNVKLLAESPVEEIMRQWAGLGYYSRARNLHACAKTVVADFGGRFPQSEATLRGLPGIGPYTAAAIAAIAFDQHAVVVDGNVERVVARYFAIDMPLPAAKSAIREKAAELTPFERPGDYAQAMMDLGATICTPRKPACALCPSRADCAARASGSPELYPRKAGKPERPLRRGAAFFIHRQDGMVLLRTRPPKGLLGGMTEFPGTEWIPSPRPEEGSLHDPVSKHADSWAGTWDDAPLWAQFAPPSVPLRKLDTSVAHIFTHFRLELEVYVAEIARETPPPPGCRWVRETDLDREALPSVMRKVLKVVRENGAVR